MLETTQTNPNININLNWVCWGCWLTYSSLIILFFHQLILSCFIKALKFLFFPVFFCTLILKTCSLEKKPKRNRGRRKCEVLIVGCETPAFWMTVLFYLLSLWVECSQEWKTKVIERFYLHLYCTGLCDNCNWDSRGAVASGIKVKVHFVRSRLS